jgi:hypothetical protein
MPKGSLRRIVGGPDAFVKAAGKERRQQLKNVGARFSRFAVDAFVLQ